jgi:hypothetical protein
VVNCGTNAIDNADFERKCLVLTDSNLDDEKVADDINYLFNHGDLPLYYTKDERLDIVNQVRGLKPE